MKTKRCHWSHRGGIERAARYAYHNSMCTKHAGNRGTARLPATVIALFACLAGSCSALGSNKPRLDNAVPGVVRQGTPAFVLITGSNFSREAQVRLGGDYLNGLTWVN